MREVFVSFVYNDPGSNLTGFGNFIAKVNGDSITQGMLDSLQHGAKLQCKQEEVTILYITPVEMPPPTY